MKTNLTIATFLLSAFTIEPAMADVAYFHPGKHEKVPVPVQEQDDGQVGMPVNRAFDLVFSQSATLAVNITTKSDLMSGKIKDAAIVANYQIDAFPPTRLGLRWTPGKSESTKWLAKIKGKHNDKHILSLTMTTEMSKPTTTLENGWTITDNKVTVLTGSILINGDQSIPADTYTLSLDASAFIS